jgi:RecA-family ATPase
MAKSLLTLDLAARVSTGRPFPGDESCPCGGVVILSGEDTLSDTIRPRLEAAGADLSRIIALPYSSETAAEAVSEIPRDIALIEQAISQIQASLVLMDPLMAYLAHNVNSFRDQDVRRALAPLQDK